MAFVFQVAELRPGSTSTIVTVEGASSPENAVLKGLGIEVVRSGRDQDLVAIVSWRPIGGEPQTVKLYSKPVKR